MSEFSDNIIADSIDYLVANYDKAPALDDLARRAGYETTHFQKLFRARVGISPKRLIQYMNMKQARELLTSGEGTLFAAQETGLSGTGRLYDLFVTCGAVTPGQVQHKGQGLHVRYGFHPTPLGEVMIGQTERGVCYLGFLMAQGRDIPVAKMKRHLPHATYTHDDAAIAGAANNIMRIWRGDGDARHKLRLDLHGTNMQLQVWQALLKIPRGETRTYSDIGADIGKPKAARAIGNAVGANPVALLIPCHRVIRATGIIDNYGWGSPRKKLLLGVEAGMNEESVS